MGASGSEPFNEELAGYKVIQRYPENNITHLSHIETDKEYLLREHTYNDENLYKKSYAEHKQRQAIADDHLTHLVRVQGKQIDHLCSNIYKIYAIWEYPYRFLSEEINERSYQNRKFQEKQIWSILASAILGLSTLQKNKIKHEMLTTKTILLDSDGLIKIADPLACGSSSNMDTIYRNRNSQGIYLSPQQCQALQSRGSYNNSYKNDVWAIGMILLQCGLLRNMSNCYKDEYQRIDYDKIHNNLSQFGHQYGDDLRIIIQLMLKRDCKDRPDWIDLQPYARKTNRNTNADVTNANMNTNTNANISFSPLSNNQQQQSSFSPYIPVSNNKQGAKVGSDYSRGEIKQSFQPKDSFRYQDSFRNPPPPMVFSNQSFNPAQHHPNLNVNTNISQSYGYPVYSNAFAPISHSIQTPTFHHGSNLMSQTSSLTASVPYQPVSSNTSSFGFQPLYRPTQYSASDRISSINRGSLFPPPPPAVTGADLSLKSYQVWKSTQQTGPSIQSNIPYNSSLTTSIPYSASRPDPLRPDYLSTRTDYLGKAPGYIKSQYTATGSSDNNINNKYTSNYLTQPVGGTTGLGIGSLGTGAGTYGINPISSTNNYSTNYNSYTSTSSNKYPSTSPFTSPSLLPTSTYTSNTNTNTNNMNINPITTTTVNANKPFDNINLSTAPLTTTPLTNTNTYSYSHDKQSQHNRLFNNYSNTNTNTNTNINANINALSDYTASKWATNTAQPLSQQDGYKYYSTNNQNKYTSNNAQSVSNTPVTTTSLNYNKNINKYQTDTQQINAQAGTNKNTYVDQQPVRDHNNRDDQRPEFVIQTFKQGSKYQGFKLRDMRHGKGKFYYQDGGMYDGNWTENKMDGFGSLYYQSGELAYQGMWKDDQFQGKGKLFNQSPQEFNGEYNYKNFDQIDQFWEYYEGDFVQDFKKGTGKLMLSNGEYFQGTFNNDMVEGPGVFHCKNGHVIKGVWRQNHLISE